MTDVAYKHPMFFGWYDADGRYAGQPLLLSFVMRPADPTGYLARVLKKFSEYPIQREPEVNK